jgi:hypothetical protein
LGSLIGRAYIEAVEMAKMEDDYIGRAVMEIIDREISPSYAIPW